MWLILALVLAPNRALTPGLLATVKDHNKVRVLTTNEVCSIKWGLDRRYVTEGMKVTVTTTYVLKRSDVRGTGVCCEFDHLIPRELGGADDVRNLWPEPWADAHVKDREENRLHRLVCSGGMTLHAAQERMRRWGR